MPRGRPKKVTTEVEEKPKRKYTKRSSSKEPAKKPAKKPAKRSSSKEPAKRKYTKRPVVKEVFHTSIREWAAPCPVGKFKNPTTRRCSKPKICKEGMAFNPSKWRCLPELGHKMERLETGKEDLEWLSEVRGQTPRIKAPKVKSEIKKPANAYIRFLQEFREKKANKPKYTEGTALENNRKLVKDAAKKWRSLSDEEKLERGVKRETLEKNRLKKSL